MNRYKIIVTAESSDLTFFVETDTADDARMKAERILGPLIGAKVTIEVVE